MLSVKIVFQTISYNMLLLTAAVIASEKWDGTIYQKNSAIQYHKAIEFLSAYDLSTFKKIADIGCGSGEVTAYIAQTNPHATVVGIDSSESMIKAAREKYQHIKNVHFYIVDACNLTHFAENEFDFVFSNSTIHWVNDHKSFFTGCAHILTPGGKLFVAGSSVKSFDLQYKSPLLLALEKMKTLNKWKPFLTNLNFSDQLYCLEKNTTEQLVQATGLTSITVKELNRQLTLTNPKTYCAWLSGWIGGLKSIQSLSPEELKDLMQELEQHIPIQADGSVSWNQQSISICAEKKITIEQ